MTKKYWLLSCGVLSLLFGCGDEMVSSEYQGNALFSIPVKLTGSIPQASLQRPSVGLTWWNPFDGKDGGATVVASLPDRAFSDIKLEVYAKPPESALITTGTGKKLAMGWVFVFDDVDGNGIMGDGKDTIAPDVLYGYAEQTMVLFNPSDETLFDEELDLSLPRGFLAMRATCPAPDPAKAEILLAPSYQTIDKVELTVFATPPKDLESANLRLPPFGCPGTAITSAFTASPDTADVPNEINNVCIAEITRAMTLYNDFDDPLFDVKPGQKLMISRFGIEKTDRTVEMAFLTPVGAVVGTKILTKGEDRGFSSNCSEDDTLRTEAVVVHDVDILDSSNNQVCKLQRGMQFFVTGHGVSYIDDLPSGEVSYELRFDFGDDEGRNQFVAACPVVADGKFRVTERRVSIGGEVRPAQSIVPIAAPR